MTAAEHARDPQAQVVDALDLAYRYLGRRDRTVAEVRRHLETKRAEPAAIDATIAELAEQGYLDDARYAVRFAEDRRTLDAWGADRIVRKLTQVGVGEAEIEAAVGAQNANAERAAALALLRRRFPVAPAEDRDRERALTMLVRKGYELELAYDVVRARARER